MAEVKVIKAEKRETSGTGEARRMRHAGKIPAVVYGSDGVESLALDTHEFTLMIRDYGSNFIGDLVIDGAAPKKVLVKDVQYHPSRGDILHADFVSVSMTEKLQVSLPVALVGEAAGVVAGGVMEQILSELEIECLPGNMIEHVEVDVSEMQIGDNLTVGDITLPEGVTTSADADLVIVAVSAPRVQAAKADAEEEGAEAAAESTGDAESA